MGQDSDRTGDTGRRDPFAATAGAYVLGALSPTDRDAFEEHLDTCAACRGAVEDLAGLPGLLSRVPREVVEEPADPPVDGDDVGATAPGAGLGAHTPPPVPPLPDTVLAGLLREVRGRRRRRRTALVGGLAAAACVVALALTSALGQGGEPGAPQAAPTVPTSPTAPASPGDDGAPAEQAMEQLGDVPVSATARLTQVLWGTKVDITCAYARELAGEPYDYALVVTDRSGGVERIGSWRAVPGQDASLSGATALTLDQIESVQVRTMSGTTVLQLVES